MKHSITFLAVAVAMGLAGCAASMTGGPVIAVQCPVPDIAAARSIAVAVIAAHADTDHLSQVGYALDVSDEGGFWLAADGPYLVHQGDAVVVQAGGSSYRFKIAKCTGAVSGLTESLWR